jgi:beta-galactosidase/beta-glucuronidase
MSIHRIRLRHPWHREPEAGTIVWRRRFNRPTGLGARERVFVVVEGDVGRGEVVLNGQPLGTLSGQRSPQPFEVTDRLLAGNELLLRLEWPSAADQTPSAAPPGEVRLEIHAAEGESPL